MMESLNRWAAGRAFLFVYSPSPLWTGFHLLSLGRKLAGHTAYTLL